MPRVFDPSYECPISLSGGAFLVVMAMCAAALSAGCETPPQTRPTAQGSSAPASSPQPSTDAAATESTVGSDLAALSARDVRHFLERQKTPADGATSDSEPDRPRVRTGDEIRWTAPAGTAPQPHELPASEPTTARSSELLLLPDESDHVADAPVQPEAEAAARAATVDLDRVRELIVELSKELYREASYSDMPLRELMLIAATTIVTPDRAIQPDAIPALTPRERELLGHFQTFFTQIGTSLDGSRTADEALQHAVDELRAAMSTKPQLYIDTMALCTRVGGFGDYDPFNRYSFLAHSEQQAVLYLELSGFTSELNQQNQWVTELSLQLMIYSDRDGIPVWSENWQSAVDISRNKRQDFFMVQILTLPRALSVGRYHMKVHVRDEKSLAEAEGSITFEMVADPKLATGTAGGQ
jgi:hypothetical protein